MNRVVRSFGAWMRAMAAKAEVLLGRESPCWIYLIDIPPHNIKIGRTKEPTAANRLQEARRWYPAARLVKSWPAMVSWEEVARAWVVSQFQLIQTGSENYLGDIDIEAVAAHLDNLFMRLPRLVIEMDLDEQEAKNWTLKGQYE